jgi:hypothetical protein
MNKKKAVSYVFREGNVVVTSLVIGQELNGTEYGSMLQSAAVSAGRYTNRSAFATEAPRSEERGMQIAELLTMLSMGFSERDILETLKSRPISTPVDSEDIARLKVRGASPAVLNEVTRPQASKTATSGGVIEIPPPPIPKFIDFEITEADLRSIGAVK